MPKAPYILKSGWPKVKRPVIAALLIAGLTILGTAPAAAAADYSVTIDQCTPAYNPWRGIWWLPYTIGWEIVATACALSAPGGLDAGYQE